MLPPERSRSRGDSARPHAGRRLPLRGRACLRPSAYLPPAQQGRLTFNRGVSEQLGEGELRVEFFLDAFVKLDE